MLPAVGSIDPKSLFSAGHREIWLEIGFGSGEHLAALADMHREVGFIGVEPFITGVAKLLVKVRTLGLGNVRVFADDARLLLGTMPDEAIDRLFILFPDPWPKRRHHKRRIVNHTTVAEFARVLRSGGELRVATDDRSYAREMLAVVSNEDRFDWLVERPADWKCRPADWPATRYETKAVAAGRSPVFLRFRRLTDLEQGEIAPASSRRKAGRPDPSLKQAEGR